MSREQKQSIGVLVCFLGIVIVVVAQLGILRGLSLNNPPTALTLEASKTIAAPGEQVTFSLTALPIDASAEVTLFAYVNDVVKARWTMSLPDDTIRVLVPSALNSQTVTFRAIYSNEVKSNVVSISISASNLPPQTVILTAAEGQNGLVTFYVTITPSGSYVGNLKAFSDVACSRELGTWSLSIISGAGFLDLMTARVSEKTVFWRANVNGVPSNVISTNGSSVVDTTLKDAATILGLVMAVAGALAAIVFRKP